jgi:hypothetical protein
VFLDAFLYCPVLSDRTSEFRMRQGTERRAGPETASTVRICGGDARNAEGSGCWPCWRSSTGSCESGGSEW